MNTIIKPKRFTDDRLPDGITIWLNAFGEYVAAEVDSVARLEVNGRYINVRASRTLEQAIQNYLNKDTNTSTLN